MKINTVKTTPDETRALSQIKAGEVFRFAYLPLTDALTENAFYMVVDAPENKGGVLVVNIHDGKQLKRDNDHRVVHHNVSMNVSV